MTQQKNILVACEESQAVCKAFRAVGCNAYSCDIQPCSGGHPEWHLLVDAIQAVYAPVHLPLQDGHHVTICGHWDLLIAHPPCTMLTKASAVRLADGTHTIEDVMQAAEFFMAMYEAPVPHICVENPIPLKVAGLPRYSQKIQPYQFGHPYSKATCLWLKNLPPLFPIGGYYVQYKSFVEHCSHTSKRRSKTFSGIAEAMAANWAPII